MHGSRAAAQHFHVCLGNFRFTLGLCQRQQIYAWRHELKKKGLMFPTADALFLPIATPEPMEAALPEAAMSRPPAPDPQIELMLANGRCLRFAPDLDPAVLVRLIRVVEAA